MTRTDYTREELIAICERAMIPLHQWSNRDTPESIRAVGECWAYLKTGCEFRVHPEAVMLQKGLYTTMDTIWVEVMHPTFNSFEYGGGHEASEIYHLPQPARLDETEGRDWYC